MVPIADNEAVRSRAQGDIEDIGNGKTFVVLRTKRIQQSPSRRGESAVAAAPCTVGAGQFDERNKEKIVLR